MTCLAITAAELPDQHIFSASCTECHDAENSKGGLDLTNLAWPPADQTGFTRWVKIFDRVNDGEMPPANRPRRRAHLDDW